jgi:hypothetical protein
MDWTTGAAYIQHHLHMISQVPLDPSLERCLLLSWMEFGWHHGQTWIHSFLTDVKILWIFPKEIFRGLPGFTCHHQQKTSGWNGKITSDFKSSAHKTYAHSKLF